jgi:hypothetical protein
MVLSPIIMKMVYVADIASRAFSACLIGPIFRPVPNAK